MPACLGLDRTIRDAGPDLSVEAGGEVSPNIMAPSFGAIAVMPGMNGRALAVWPQSSPFRPLDDSKASHKWNGLVRNERAGTDLSSQKCSSVTAASKPRR